MGQAADGGSCTVQREWGTAGARRRCAPRVKLKPVTADSARPRDGSSTVP
jgi:hypothetical protein